METKKWPLRARQGNVFNFAFRLRDKVLGPWDLTGWTAVFHVRAKGAAQDVLTATTANGGVVLSDGGRVEVTISAEAMSAVPAGKYEWEIDLNDETPLAGSFTVKAQVG